LERDLNNTEQQTTNISDSLEVISSKLTATLQQLDEATATVSDTLLYAQQLNASEAKLLNIFTSIRAELHSSQQQIYNLSDRITSIANNATIVAMMSDDAAATANRTLEYITMAIETLNQLESSLVPMLESVTMLITEQASNGSGLYTELMAHFALVTSQASQLFNTSWRSLNIINSTVQSLMNSSALQPNVSAGTVAQMVVSQGISDDLNSLSDDLNSIQQSLQILIITDFFAEEEMQVPLLVSMDQISKQLQDAIQLTTDARSLLGNTSTLIVLINELYAMFSSYEASYALLTDQIQMLEQEAFRLYNDSVTLNQNAMTASLEANQLVTEAQNLQVVLQNFSGFVDAASEMLLSIEAIQMSALDATNTANNISNMIMETYQTVNASLLILMESSDLTQVIEMVSAVCVVL